HRTLPLSGRSSPGQSCVLTPRRSPEISMRLRRPRLGDRIGWRDEWRDSRVPTIADRECALVEEVGRALTSRRDDVVEPDPTRDAVARDVVDAAASDLLLCCRCRARPRRPDRIERVERVELERLAVELAVEFLATEFCREVESVHGAAVGVLS